jgi:hypothetical protein
MFKRRTVILTLILSALTGMLSLIPYNLTQNGYEINGGFLVVGWMMLIISILAFAYSFLSVIGSMMMLALMSFPSGINLLAKANNPYTIVAWKEANQEYELISRQNRDNLNWRDSNAI